MSEWTESEDSGKENQPHSDDDFKQPAKKKTRIQKQQTKKQDKSRFAESVSSSKLATMTKAVVPKNTQKNTGWALRNFSEWRKEREKRCIGEKCRPGLFDSPPWDVAELNHWLCLYVLETRRTDGKKYPITTVYQLLSGILRYMRTVDPECPNFLDRDNHKFKELHAAIDNLGRQLRTEGVGAEVKHASIVSREEEDALWAADVLGTNNPIALLRAVFFLNGKNFCLRGGSEHRNLKLSQLQRLSNPDRYLYTENGSKNHSGRLCERNVENKCVPIISTYDQVGERCHVFLLDLYISKMPQKAKEMDYFYLRPLDSKPQDSSAPWYYVSPVGEHKLGRMVKETFSEIGITGKTNHSLRATGASALFEANVPEKIIQERTGHRSVKALRMYERTTEHQHHQVSHILSSRNPQQSFHWQNQQQATSNFSMTPSFGMLQNCTININYGPSTVNTQHQAGVPTFDNLGFPEEVEKELAHIDM